MHDRKELVAAINAVLDEYHSEHDESVGAALQALDALGYAAGQIFSCAPDLALQQHGRNFFLAAIQEGLRSHPMETIH
jgi:hypothetical protein